MSRTGGGRDPERVDVLEFELGGQPFGVGVGRVDSVDRVPDSTGVPNTPAAVRGVARVADATAVVVDGRRLYGRDDGDAGGRDPEGRLIHLDRGDGTPIGLIVDRVAGEATHRVGGIEPVEPGTDAAARVGADPSLYAGVSRDTSPVRLIAVEGIADAVRPERTDRRPRTGGAVGSAEAGD